MHLLKTSEDLLCFKFMVPLFSQINVLLPLSLTVLNSINKMFCFRNSGRFILLFSYMKWYLFFHNAMSWPYERPVFCQKLMSCCFHLTLWKLFTCQTFGVCESILFELFLEFEQENHFGSISIILIKYCIRKWKKHPHF